MTPYPSLPALAAAGQARRLEAERICPFTEACRAQALEAWSDVPELAALFRQRPHCGERDPVKQARCARRLGLDDAAEEG